jgi:hypothetical protein
MKFKSFVLASAIALCLCVPAPAKAQQNVVEQARADLAASGFDVNKDAACVDFEIAKIVAGRLAAQGAGLLQKDCCGDFNDPNRTHCEYTGPDGASHGYSHDIVAFSDGTIVDIAIGDGKNSPSWQQADPDPSLKSRYRSATSLGLTGQVKGMVINPPVVPPVTPPTVDLGPLQNAISALAARVQQLEAQLSALAPELDHADQETTAKIDAIKIDVESLKARKVPTGCRVQFLACRLTE